MSDDVTITVRVNNQTGAGFRDINGQLRTLDGRFASSAGNMRRSSDGINRALVDVRASLLSLAPAAVPVAASLAPIAVQAGAASVAVAAFGAAVLPQIGNLGDAAKAQDKYTQAVQQYGAHSKQAVAAQLQAAQSLAGLPKATQQAAAAYSNLRDQFKAFSDSTAKFTLAPVEHSFAVLGQILPKLKPMVEGTSTQLDRLVKVAGGAVNTSGFDALSKKFSDFANSSLKNATDGAIHFIRVLSEGNARGPLTEFIAYAKAQGPAVKETLSNLVRAIGNIAQGAADAGPGLLTIVNAFAKLVAAVPPQLVGTLLQVYSAFKLIKLAGAGIGAIAGGFTTLAGKVAALQGASVAAGGGLAGLRAAFLSLGTAAKASVVVAGIAAIVLVLTRLSNIGKKAPPDVDRMTTAIANLGRTGKVSGEALRVYGKDLGGLADSLRTLARPSNLDKTQQFLTSLIGMDSTPVKKAKEDFDGIDKALANLVKGGKADLARVALEDVIKSLKKQGFTSKEVKGQLDDYKSALADQALEQRLTADSMGLFGAAAVATSDKLAQQKASADGLRQAIQALSDTSRGAFDAQTRFEEALDNVTQSIKDHGQTLNINTADGRANRDALSQLASATQDAAAKARENGESWQAVNKIYDTGYGKIIKSARALGLNKEQAKALADQILKIPDKNTVVKMNKEDAQRDLETFNTALRKAPGSKSVTLKTLSKSGEAVLKAFGLKVERLPNGEVKVTAATGSALGAIADVSSAINALDGDTANTYVNTYQRTYFETIGRPGQTVPASHRPDLAAGGPVRGYASGGGIQHFPNGGFIKGPGTPTSDSIFAAFPSGAAAMVSDTEYVVQASAVRKYGVGLLDALNAGRLKIAGFARGGATTAEAQARRDAAGDLSISHFGRYAGYQQDEFQSALSRPNSIGSLVTALNQWRSIIMKATHGSTESKLLRQLDSTGKSLLKWEKQLNGVTKSLEKAKDKLASLKDAASQLASSVKGNLISSANITRGTGEGPVTLASVKAGLTASRDKVTAFAAALKKLKAKGFSASIIQQVAEAGIDGGGLETAGALLQASASDVKSINATQTQIASAAGSAGKTTADAVYAKAIALQTAAVKVLTRQQQQLQKSMDKLTKALEKAIEKAFGKKAAGGVVGAAASGGLRSSLTWVGEHGPELLDLPAGSRVWSNPDSRRKAAQAPWASMLTAPSRRPGGAAAPAAAGGDRPIVLNVQFGAREFGQIWIDVGRKEVKTRGGLSAALGGN